MMQVYRKTLELVEAGRPCALGTVIYTAGSTPQKPGSRTLVDASGRVAGTLGGGMVEARGLDQVKAALESGRAHLAEYRLDADYSREAGPICGGVMRIFAHRVSDADAAAIRAAFDALDRRVRGLLVTAMAGADGVIRWYPEHEITNGAADALPENAVRLLDGGRPVCARLPNGAEVFLEPVTPQPRLLVVGGGHVGQEVVRLAAGLGFDVTVIDDREEFTHPSLFPEGVVAVQGDIRSLVGAFPQDRDTYIVLVSKGHRPDAEALEGCIHGNAAYIGMIGSKRKIRSLRKHFLEDGLATEAEWNRIAAPIGFDIGAITVPEIGVSIAAQLIAARRRGVTTAGAMHEQLRGT